MKPLLLAFFTLFTAVVHADINYSGVWKDTEGKFYSIHQRDDSVVVAELDSYEKALSPFEQGSLMMTINPLDLAITGQGFFILESKNGSYIYTRMGSFAISADGYIVNDRGEKLVMEKGATLPDDFVKIIVGHSGVVNLQNSEGKLVEFDRIKLASIAPKDLQYYIFDEPRYKAKNEDAVTYFYPTEENGGALQQGMLESLFNTSQNWSAYTGKLIDNYATIKGLFEPDSKFYAREIEFKSESTAVMMMTDWSLLEREIFAIQLIKEF